MRKVRLLWLFVLIGGGAYAQDSENPVDQVYRMLISPPAPLPQNPLEALENGPWEALAYLDPGQIPTDSSAIAGSTSALQEAVPDVYSFSGGLLRLEPFVGAVSGPKPAPIEVYYTLRERALILTSPKDGPERDRWTVHYLDAHYLVLDMGDLRLFLTHP